MTKSDKILEAALRLFITNGFHGTPTSKIAKEAGVANGTLFHYFNTKEILISELYLSVKKHLSSYLSYDLGKCKTTKEKAKHVCIGWVKWGVENPDKFTFFQQFANSPFINSVSREEGAKNFNFAFEIIEDGIINGSLINIDKYLITSILFGATNGLISFALEFPEKFDDDYFETGFKMIWRSIANI